MTRTECEQAIMEKLGEIRKIYEEFDSVKTPEGVSIGMHLSYTPEEMADEEGLFMVGWYASVTCFVTDANDDTHYILNAFTNDGEMYETDTRTLVKGVEI